MAIGVVCVMDKRFTREKSIVIGTYVERYFEGSTRLYIGKVTEIWTLVNERSQEAHTVYQVSFHDGDVCDYTFNEIVDWVRPKVSDGESCKIQTCMQCITVI